MTVIFLDIDGVLNSLSFYEKRGTLEPLDPHSLVLLKTLVNASGAELVLTSSWRNGWSSREEECGEEGRILNREFRKYDLKILDKTGAEACPPEQTRCREILRWLKKAPESVLSFVILDDGDYAWKKYGLDRFLVCTDFMKGGLNTCHLREAMEILKNPPLSVRKLLLMNFLRIGF